MKRLICIFLASIHLAGCTTMSVVPYADGKFVHDPVREGDQVVLMTKGVAHHITVTSMTPDQICGRSECVDTQAIDTVAREEFSAIKTGLFVLGVVLLGAAVASASFHTGSVAASSSQCWFCGI